MPKAGAWKLHLAMLIRSMTSRRVHLSKVRLLRERQESLQFCDHLLHRRKCWWTNYGKIVWLSSRSPEAPYQHSHGYAPHHHLVLILSNRKRLKRFEPNSNNPYRIRLRKVAPWLMEGPIDLLDCQDIQSWSACCRQGSIDHNATVEYHEVPDDWDLPITDLSHPHRLPRATCH